MLQNSSLCHNYARYFMANSPNQPPCTCVILHEFNERNSTPTWKWREIHFWKLEFSFFIDAAFFNRNWFLEHACHMTPLNESHALNTNFKKLSEFWREHKCSIENNLIVIAAGHTSCITRVKNVPLCRHYATSYCAVLKCQKLRWHNHCWAIIAMAWN